MHSVSMCDEYDLPQIWLDFEWEGKRQVILCKVEMVKEGNEMVNGSSSVSISCC